MKLFIGLATSLLLLGLTELASANFIGNYSTTNYFDLNIQDGVNIQKGPVDVTIAGSALPQIYHVTIDEGFGPVRLPDYQLSTPNRLEQPLRNQDWGFTIAIDSLFVSNGTHMAMAFITQEHDNPLDIAVSGGSWQRGTPSAGSLVGSWNITYYSYPNLRDTATGFQEGYGSGSFIWGGENTILVPWDFTQVALQVDGNTAYLPAPVNTGTSIIHAMNFSYDKTGLSLFSTQVSGFKIAKIQRGRPFTHTPNAG